MPKGQVIGWALVFLIVGVASLVLMSSDLGMVIAGVAESKPQVCCGGCCLGAFGLWLAAAMIHRARES